MKGMVSEIYTWIEAKYPFFGHEHGPRWWKKSVRHNLSSNSAFLRHPEVAEESVWCWTLHDSIIKEMDGAGPGYVPQSLSDGRYKVSQERVTAGIPQPPSSRVKSTNPGGKRGTSDQSAEDG